MESNGGGWTVIQRRKSGLTSFNRDWKQYKKGFGTIRGDFWLGNDNIFRLTRQPSVLRIEMEVRGERGYEGRGGTRGEIGCLCLITKKSLPGKARLQGGQFDLLSLVRGPTER